VNDIFFDLDRTLWDFDKNSQNALKQIFEENNLNNFYQNFYQFYSTYKNVNSDLWVKYGKKKISKEELRDTRFLKTLERNKIFDKQLANKISQEYIYLSPRQIELFPTTLETLIELKNRNYNLHIITNGFEEVQYIKLKESKLEEYFDIIVCSEHVGFNKPDKRIFYHALKLANAKIEQSMMIGDDLKIDVLGANQLGIEAILFDPYNDHKTQSFKKINRLEELLSIV
jgi:putative hydrolase of the HAD superfamily